MVIPSDRLYVSPFPAPPSPLVNEEILLLHELVANLTMSREAFARRLADERRDIDKECGYPKTGAISPELYADLYEREAIATRVVEVLPAESWKVQPTVYEDEDAEKVTAFEEAWDELGNALRGTSFFKQEEGSPIWEYLERIDILSGIGQYGIILLGLDDGLPFDQPATKATKLLYMRVFPEYLAQVTQVESDPTNPRYGMPTMYQVTFNDNRDSLPNAAVAGVTTTMRSIHWTRVIHIADNLRSSEVFGMQRLRAPYNRLLDIKKIFGATGEGHWQQAFSTLAFETDPTLAGKVKVNRESLKNEVENLRNGLQRELFLNGVSAKNLSGSVTDSSKHLDTLITVICIVIGVPKRIFMGSERGELSSGQDSVEWERRLQKRRRRYLTSSVIVPLVDRLIILGVLPTPKDGYRIYWPDGGAQSDSEKADIALKRTQAITTFVSGNGESAMALFDFYTRIMGYTEEEAEAIIEAMKEAQEEKLAEGIVQEGTQMQEGLNGVLEGEENGQPAGGDEGDELEEEEEGAELVEEVV
jgi:hypothetical protein